MYKIKFGFEANKNQQKKNMKSFKQAIVEMLMLMFEQVKQD